MFDRKSIKEFARFRLKQGYWMVVLVVIVAGLLGAAVPAPSLPSFNFSVSGPVDGIFSQEDDTTDADTGTVWDDAQPYEEDGADDSVPDTADPDVWEDPGLGEKDWEAAWEEFKAEMEEFFARPSVDFGVSLLILVFCVVFLFALILATLQTIFLGNIVTVGLNGWLLRFWRGENLSFKELFACFRIYKPSLKTMLVRDIYLILWNLLPVVGIIKSYAYAMVPYIIYENPNLTPNQAVALSEKLTRGYKWKLFVMELSFFWWDMLSAVTFGIVGLLYVNPYKCLSFAGVYEQLKWAALQEGRADWSDFGQLPPAELWDEPAAPIVAEPIPEDNV